MFTLLEVFHWSQLLQPQFYIEHGGLWLILFVVFAETGLFAGFFLPGDSLLFVAGIYAGPLAAEVIPSSNEWINLLVLTALISVAGILGNEIPRLCVVGNTVNMASRLQSTAEENTIQMSEAMYNIAKNTYFDANIKYIFKENIVLKNIGAVNTYKILTPIIYDDNP